MFALSSDEVEMPPPLWRMMAALAVLEDSFDDVNLVHLVDKTFPDDGTSPFLSTPLTNQGCLGNSSCSISLVSSRPHGEPFRPSGKILGDDKDGSVDDAAAELTASVTF